MSAPVLVSVVPQQARLARKWFLGSPLSIADGHRTTQPAAPMWHWCGSNRPDVTSVRSDLPARGAAHDQPRPGKRDPTCQLPCFLEPRRLVKDSRVTVSMIASASAISPATWAVSTGARAEESATGPAWRLVP
jgi:hypothetical protein